MIVRRHTQRHRHRHRPLASFHTNVSCKVRWVDTRKTWLELCLSCTNFLLRNIEGRLWGPLWRHRWRHHHENTFFSIIWDDIFISEVKLKLCLIFQNFQNGHYFELATNFFTGSYTGSWIDQKDSHEHFRHFELLIDALAQILTEIYHFQNLTYFVTWWRHRWRHECVKHNLHN